MNLSLPQNDPKPKNGATPPHLENENIEKNLPPSPSQVASQKVNETLSHGLSPEQGSSPNASQTSKFTQSKPPSQNTAQSNTPNSSESSGPLFPPGFEDRIPLATRTALEKKRTKKCQKRNKNPGKKKATPSRQIETPNLPSFTITAENTISLSQELGIRFDGEISELHNRVISILRRQNSDWMAQQGHSN